VERYFSDFLSAMESKDRNAIKLYDGDGRSANGKMIPKTLGVPQNLFVIGTMNVDETTYMFSPKVLDRAQVLEFRVDKDDIETFLSSPTKPNFKDLASKGAQYAGAFLKLAKERKTKELEGTAKDAVKIALTKFFPGLAKLGAEFGYRTASEIVTFVAYYLDASGYKDEADDKQKSALQNEAIDAAILQKLLPKLHGSRNRLESVLDVLITETKKTDAEDAPKLYPLTKEKLERMKTRLIANNFTSFAEA
jgi:5-methylcytosine-specific restriction protein B